MEDTLIYQCLMVKALLQHLGWYWQYINPNTVCFYVIYAKIFIWIHPRREVTIYHCSAAVTWCCFVLSGWCCNDCSCGSLGVMMSFIWIMLRDKMRCRLLSGDRSSLSNGFYLLAYTVWFSGWWTKKLSSRYAFTLMHWTENRHYLRLFSQECRWNFDWLVGKGKGWMFRGGKLGEDLCACHHPDWIMSLKLQIQSLH